MREPTLPTRLKTRALRCGNVELGPTLAGRSTLCSTIITRALKGAKDVYSQPFDQPLNNPSLTNPVFAATTQQLLVSLQRNGIQLQSPAK